MKYIYTIHYMPDRYILKYRASIIKDAPKPETYPFSNTVGCRNLPARFLAKRWITKSIRKLNRNQETGTL